MGECRVCHCPLHDDGVCMACEPGVEIEALRLELSIAIRQRDETEVLLSNAHRVRDKALVERDVARIQYHDGMEALLWLVQLYTMTEVEDEIEAALEVAEEKLAIWAKIRKEA